MEWGVGGGGWKKHRNDFMIDVHDRYMLFSIPVHVYKIANSGTCLVRILPSRHTTLKQCRFNVNQR